MDAQKSIEREEIIKMCMHILLGLEKEENCDFKVFCLVRSDVRFYRQYRIEEC